MMGRFALTWGLSDIVRVGVVGGLLSCIDCALVGRRFSMSISIPKAPQGR